MWKFVGFYLRGCRYTKGLNEEVLLYYYYYLHIILSLLHSPLMDLCLTASPVQWHQQFKFKEFVKAVSFFTVKEMPRNVRRKKFLVLLVNKVKCAGQSVTNYKTLLFTSCTHLQRGWGGRHAATPSIIKLWQVHASIIHT